MKKQLGWFIFIMVGMMQMTQACDTDSLWHLDLNALKEKNCALKQNDKRGFTAYDIAALRGQAEVQQWLLQQQLAQKNAYSKSLIKLVQTGLRYLGHDAGIINGELNAQTIQAIKSYQKAQQWAVNGRLDASWLSAFYRQVTKKMQQQFNDLGMDVGSADGLIGTQTRQVMQQFRKKHHLPVADYAQVDDQLIYRLMMEVHDAAKKAKPSPAKPVAKKEPASTQKVAAAKTDKQTTASASKAQNKTAASASKTSNKTPASASKTPNTSASKASKTASSTAKTVSKNATSTTKSSAKTASNAVAKPASKVAQQALPQPPRKKSSEQILAEQRKQQAAEDRDAGTATITKKGGFAKVSGRLNGSGSSCNIGGQRIDGYWCKIYPNSSKDTSCSALLDGGGKVLSLTCGKRKKKK